MLEIFRNNNFVFTLLLIPYAALIRMLAIYFGTDLVFDSGGTWTRWFFGDQIEQSGLLQIAAVFLVFLQAAMINRIVIRNRMTNEMTLFPGVFYILIVSFFPSYVGLSSFLLANTFILILLDQLFVTHKKVKTAERIFSVGFWFSCAVLTESSYFLLLPFLILGLSMLRTVRLINWTQLLIGIMTPLVMSIMIAIIIGEDPRMIGHDLIADLGVYNFTFQKDWQHYGQVVFFGLWMTISLLQYNAFTLKKNIHAQKKIDLCFWLLLFAFFCIFFSTEISVDDWLVISIPLSVMIAMTFIRIRAKLTTELLHFVLIICLLAFQILMFF